MPGLVARDTVEVAQLGRQLYERIGGRPSDPMESLFSSAMREWRRSAGMLITAIHVPSMRRGQQIHSGRMRSAKLNTA